jgi:hypothetical protein
MEAFVSLLAMERVRARQPETAGVPSLAVSLVAYNYYQAVATVTETFGTVMRTKAITYDPAGREPQAK